MQKVLSCAAVMSVLALVCGGLVPGQVLAQTQGRVAPIGVVTPDDIAKGIKLGNTPPPVLEEGQVSVLKGQSIRVGTQTRTFDLALPGKTATKNAKRPLVIMLHGGGGNAANAQLMTGFNELATAQGMVVAYPNGSGNVMGGTALLTWNAVHCCGFAMTSKSDDVGFISKLIDHLIATQNVDPRRVYVTGMSNGGMMTQRVGRELSHKVAAIAPVVSGLFGDEPAPRGAVPALIVNGGLDETIPVNGGQTGGASANAWDGTPLKPVSWQGEVWRKASTCLAKTTVTTENEVVTHTVYQCPGKREVRQVLIADHGHAWPGRDRTGRPGADVPSQAWDASVEILKFFNRHSK
jgi:polyhydroxybutyrate depolymerase